MSTVLKSENLIVKTPDGKDLKCGNLEFKKGEIIAIVGGLSSGKSLMLSSLAGLFKIKHGLLKIFETDLAVCEYRDVQKVRARTGFVFEIGGLLSNLSLYENIALPLRYHFKRLRKNVVDRQIIKNMKLFSISDYSNLRPADVPLEVKKRCLFARALIMRPQLIFFDEPFVGLGYHGRKMIKNLMQDLLKTGNKTIVTAISETELIYSLASQFVIMSDKEIKYIVKGREELDRLRKEDTMVANLFNEVSQ